MYQGFRKVDPDRWEFANEWFLRGQTQLLSKIVRRKNTGRSSIKHEDEDDDDEDDEELVMEIEKLRHEQRSIEEELESMNLRLQATERRPHQMMTFLNKVVEDPHILPQIMLDRGNIDGSSKRKREIVATPPSSSIDGSSEVCLSFFGDGEMARELPPPYPFSLLDGGF